MYFVVGFLDTFLHFQELPGKVFLWKLVYYNIRDLKLLKLQKLHWGIIMSLQIFHILSFKQFFTS